MPVTQAQVVEALRPVQDPELHRSIVDLGMVKDVTIAGSDITVQVALTVPGCPLRAEIDQRVTDAIHGLDSGASVAVDFTVMSEGELRALRERLHGEHGSVEKTCLGYRRRRQCRRDLYQATLRSLVRNKASSDEVGRVFLH